jgi:hypothetical protein
VHQQQQHASHAQLGQHQGISGAYKGSTHAHTHAHPTTPITLNTLSITVITTQNIRHFSTKPAASVLKLKLPLTSVKKIITCSGLKKWYMIYNGLLDKPKMFTFLKEHAMEHGDITPIHLHMLKGMLCMCV